MDKENEKRLWDEYGMTRREFLKAFGIASSALTLSPFFLDRLSMAIAQIPPKVKVYLVKNGDCFQNVSKIWELGGFDRYIDKDDFVVIKGNGQWENQGYTHTGCIKGVVDEILGISGFSGEVFICDNVQIYGGAERTGFDATPPYRINNWPDHNWTTLANAYKSDNKPVGVKRWLNSEGDISGPADGEGWIRSYFPYYGRDTYLSYPIFESPLSSGVMVDMKNGIWENGSYTGQKVKAIFMPNLNNHGSPSYEDYAGITSAVKSFFGATEIHGGVDGRFNGYYNMHSSTYARDQADYAGELTARYISNLYSPVLHITAAMWSGHGSRTGINDAAETKTVLACENPATLDYVACKYVISPYKSFLDPDQNNNTRRQITGCIAGGVGTINPAEFEIVSYDFDNPTVHRLDIDRKIKEFKAGTATEQEVKDLVRQYMEETSEME